MNNHTTFFVLHNSIPAPHRCACASNGVGGPTENSHCR